MDTYIIRYFRAFINTIGLFYDGFPIVYEKEYNEDMKRFLRRVATHLHFTILGVEPPKGFLSTLASLLALLTAGTLFYSKVEGWSLFDSLYFSVVTITTVGYGDMHPTSTLSKTFTMFLIFMGVGLGVYVITTFTTSLRRGKEKRLERFEALARKLTPETEK